MTRKKYNIKGINTVEDLGLRAILLAIVSWKPKFGARLIQHALNMLGSDLKVDGWLGGMTMAELAKYSVENIHDSISLSLSQYLETQAKSTGIDYLDVAFGELGQTEIKGDRHNPRILEYHAVSGGFSTDEVPWCGSFVNWVMKESGYTDTPRHPARALSWINYGYSAHKPTLGAIAVKSRKDKKGRSIGGHVTFVVGQSKSGKYLYCLGGNQGDKGSIVKYNKAIFKDFRLPIGVEKRAVPIYTKKYARALKEV